MMTQKYLYFNTRICPILHKQLKNLYFHKYNYSKTKDVNIEDNERMTHFGFKEVKESEKAKEG